MTENIVTELPRWGAMLAVGAHPDDESFGMGAVLALFADTGTRITVLSFTHGEASTLHGIDGDLARIRAGELVAAGRMLGVDRSELLVYPDGGLAEQPLEELAGHVRDTAETVGANGLLVFDEGGITGHPDHRRATEAALDAADRIGLPALAWAIPLSVASRLNAEFGTAFVGRADRDLDIVLRVDRARQRRAIAEHRSQSASNPVLWRRLELLGDNEWLRWLRPPRNGLFPGGVALPASPARAPAQPPEGRNHAGRADLLVTLPTQTRMAADEPPILRPKPYGEPSMFRVQNLLREGRRQRGLPDLPVPDVCMLDPDGDVVRHLEAAGLASRHTGWACYHSELWVTRRGEHDIGIVPCAVGAPYAVLVAEELNASGCGLIVSITSAGRILPMGDPPYFVLIERAWRDEGTSLHYLPPSAWSHLRPELVSLLDGAFEGLAEPVRAGRSWTTDAPFRETKTAIAMAKQAGVHAVEMEAAALYAYATAQQRDIVCVAHVTNNMGIGGDDFEKGSDGGTYRILAVVEAIARTWKAGRSKAGHGRPDPDGT